jgi:putative Holliday junction resolvase
MSLVMSYDFGLKYIGVAVGQPITSSATGIATLICRKPERGKPAGKPNWREVRDLIAAHKPAALVVGLPLNMDGSESEMASNARAFAAKLEHQFGLPVHLHDERLSSRAAAEQLEYAQQAGKAKTDHELAACLILESWLSDPAR